ncbi:uncharacterized protein ALTATR162_LOCUS8716 [Alternaria atra]|uniref:Uncharacterized protein n=1 Tax=Alternaria atra TaxID=119953 RepID=A0A8J2N2I5_9PLEO|nr:uncharacterized protein ALTATR162_LOCUS8716 [Alternaria atra]CAG5178469.1 unnamed protein product [Alternaria atra]
MGSSYRDTPIGQNLNHANATFSASNEETSSTKVQPGDSNTDTQSEHVATSTTETTTPVPPPRCPYLQHLDLIRMGAQFEEEK